MKEKDSAAKQQILDSALVEFMEKGFIDASMRSIAEKAGFTTGMLYSRFVDKNAIFHELVDDAANKLYKLFIDSQNEFASFDAKKQKDSMHGYVDGKMFTLIDIIYDNYDAFKLLICKSSGSEYEHYVDKMVEAEAKSTRDFVCAMREANIKVDDIEDNLNHMLSSALFNCLFEVVAHEFRKEDATKYIIKVQRFFNAGWDELLNM